MRLKERLASWLRHAGPVTGFAGLPEALRASIGIGLGIAVTEWALIVLGSGISLPGLVMIAPFGASALLLFAVPNSPLAQPWPVLVGNALSALVAIFVVQLVPAPLWQAPLAVGLALFAMYLTRSLHPPGGAVALLLVLSPDLVRGAGPDIVLMSVALGSGVMVLVAIPFARLTGRHYPFRQAQDLNATGTRDVPPLDRAGLSHDALAGLLQEFRQSANIGVEDLSRLIAAAERLEARGTEAELRCDQIMSRDLVTVAPGTPLSEVAALFRQHGFTSLPVTGPDRRYLGVIFQIHLIRRGAEEAGLRGSRFAVALGRILGRDPEALVRAEEVMARDIPHAEPQTPIADLLPLLAVGPCDAVPVLVAGRIEGIVTRTDLIAALARIRG